MRLDTFLLLLSAILACWSTTALSAVTSKQTAVVVGGGPAGLASALMLARTHGYQVTVLDSAPSKEALLEFDPSRAYLYNINGRGQKFTKRYPSLQKAMAEQGVGISKFERLGVPADPEEIFETDQPWSRGGLSQEVLDKMGTLFWIPRYLFLKVLLREVESEDNISVCFGQQCQGVVPQTGDNKDLIQVNSIASSSDEEPKLVSHSASLVIGAEGPRSSIRDTLETQPTLFQGWKNYHPRKFRIHKWKSPSVGLRLKTLQLEPNLKIPVGDGTSVSTKSLYTYGFESVNKGGKNAITLTLLPIRDPSAKRPVAVATPPNHDLWKLKTGPEMKEWMSRAFPRFPFNATDDGTGHRLVTDEEWERFARSEGSRFPHCQYCSGLSISSPSGDSGIALVGDTIHAFPPDMGQGVNMALGDVAVLDDCLAENSGKKLSDALESYQDKRVGETKAVVRMNRFAAPFQYAQKSRRMKFLKFFWTLNVALRMGLSKLSNGRLPSPGIVAMMDPEVPFELIVKRADWMTAGLWCAVLATICGKIFLL